MGIIYGEGRANADGKIPFPNSLDAPLSVFTGHIFDKTTIKKPSQNSEGLLKLNYKY